MNLTPIKTPLRILALTCTVAMLAACFKPNISDATSPPTSGDTPQARNFVGTQECLSCHEDKETYLETGHNFQLNKIVDGKQPQYPFTDITGGLESLYGIENATGTPKSYDDISYVAGGHLHSAVWLDKEGFIVIGEGSILRLPGTGPKGGRGLVAEGKTISRRNMYNYSELLTLETNAYWCGRCHTTGWKQYTSGEGDTRNLNRQDDLPGMDGTFDFTGIQCEACHGAGSDHIESPSTSNITRIAKGRTRNERLAEDMAYGKPVACMECHSGFGGGDRHYPDYVSPFNAKFGGDSLGGLMPIGLGGPGGNGGRAAADGLLGIDPDTGVAMGKMKDFHCSTCHNPHLSTHFRDKPGHDYAVKECTDCHDEMKFRNADADSGSAAAHKNVAECIDCHMPDESHFFKINISVASSDKSNYSEDGAYRKPWSRPSDSCQGCHVDFEGKAAKMKKVHL